jgi:predicted amidohydrolase YtcJ
MSADADIRVYQELLRRGELKTRIYCARSVVSWELLGEVGIRAGFGGPMLRLGGIKGFADGSLGSSTALFFEPYTDEPENRGLLFEQMLPEGIMEARARGADSAGLQMMIHAIGDEANARILDVYKRISQTNPAWERRFRIEHAQHVLACDIPRLGAQNVVASVQPYHLADDGRWCEKRLGRERSRFSYSFRSLLKSGAVLAFGSDWTVAPLNPLLGLQAAVTRETWDGSHPGGWIPKEKLTLDEALRAFTWGSAYAEFSEHEKGTLAPGMLADLVVLTKDLWQLDPHELKSATVALTVMGGGIVFES